MKNHFWAFAVIISLGAGLLIGIFLQYHHIPSHVKWSVINVVQDFRGESNFDYSLSVDPVRLKAYGKPVKVFDSETTYVGSTEPEKSSMEGEELLSYRYFWHLKEIADYLVSDEAREEGLRIHDDFWSVKDRSIADYLIAVKSKREFLKGSLGLKELPFNGKIKTRSVAVSNDLMVIEKVRLESRIPKISVPCYIAKPKNMQLKGVVIAIHGAASVPEKLIGIEPPDYTRQFGLELTKNGYVVVAPYIINISNKTANISGLGMLYTGNTHWSIDLQKLLSVVDYIKSNPELSDLPIITYGISIGGLYAIMLPALDTRVDIAISSGFLTRFPLESDYYLEKEINNVNYAMTNNANQNICFKYSDYVRLIYPRPLIVEMGALDNPVGDIGLWLEIKQLYARHKMNGNLKMVWFKGFHETSPQLVAPILNRFVENIER